VSAVQYHYWREPSKLDGPPVVTAELRDADDGSAWLVVEVDPRKLWGRDTYALELRPTVSPQTFELPEWCRRWSIALHEMPACAAAPAAENCNRTPLLWEFVTSVWRIMLDEYRPQLGSVYLYLEK